MSLKTFIDHYTVVCSVTWPLHGSEARVDLVLIQTSLLLSCKYTQIASEQLDLHNKRSEVCIETKSTPASLPCKGQITEQTTVKWSSILFRFAQPNRKHFYYKYRRQEIQQIVEGAAINNRVYYKNLRHAKYRLQAGGYKKMSHAIANNKK